jgi:tol-pal system protein YbgF
MIRQVGLFLLVASLAPAYAADKTIMELQRDVGLLADQVTKLQQTQDRQLAVLQTLIQQSLDASHQTDRSVAGIQSNFQQNANQLKDQVVAPVVGLGTRMDQVSSDVRTLQQAVADLTSSVSRISAQLSDLNNTIKVLSTPPVQPPTQGSGTAMPGAQSSGAPPMNQTDLFNAAQADYNSGKFDLSLQEYQDYLKYYGNSDLAPSAQYWIGQIYYSNKKYPEAADAFDLVITKYPDNSKAKEAMLYKGMSLVATGSRNQAHTVFQEIEKKFANTDAATRACNEDKQMGLTCYGKPASSTANRKKGR